MPDHDDSALAEHIGARFSETRIAEIERLDIAEYLRDTAMFRESPAERVRQLAICLESEASSASQPRGWLALDRVYAAGASLDPRDGQLVLSRALSALRCGESIGQDSEAFGRILRAARGFARVGLSLLPDDAAAHTILADVLYRDPLAAPGDALRAFEDALRYDSKYEWAKLYRAHCLQDLERWREAADAYATVDPAFFVGHQSWRYDLLREQRAWCLLKAGDSELALQEIDRLLSRYEKEPELAQMQIFAHLQAIADSDPASPRAARIRRILAL